MKTSDQKSLRPKIRLDRDSFREKIRLDRRPRISPESPNHWDRITLNPHRCFVCDRAFTALQMAHAISIGYKEGVLLRRHKTCDALSERWKKKFKGCWTLTIEKQEKD